MNDDELREKLQGAVPDAPDPTGWAVTARLAAGRRTTGRWVTAGVAVALVAIMGAMLWPFGAGNPQLAVPAASPAATAADVPARQTNPDCTDASDSPSGGLREQVVRISLCPRTDGPTFTTPVDPLTTGINDVIRDIAALPAETSRDPDCSTETDRRYRIVFIGGGGKRTTVEAATANACGVKPGSANFRRWDGLLTVLGEAWAAQRATRTAPDVAVDCLPFDRPGLFVPQMSDLEQTAACMTDPESGDLQVRGPMSREFSQVIIEDVARNASRAQNIDSRRDGPVLTLAGPWGDPLVFWRVEGDQWFAFVPDGEGTQLFWDPEPKTEDVLRHLLQTAPNATASPAPSENPYVPTLCRGLTPTAGPLPTTATRLRLCPAGSFASQVFTPLDTVDGDRALTVLRVLNAQTPMTTPAACTADYGPDFLLVAESDGAPPVVMVLQLYGCRVAGTSADQRSGGDQVLTEFKAQLSEQRKIGRAALLERAGPLCLALPGIPTSVMPVQPDDAVGVTHCRYASTNSPSARETKVDVTAARRLLDDMRGRIDDQGMVSCPATRESEPHITLALTTMQADVLTLTPSACGQFQFDSPGGPRWWTPSPDAARVLEQLARE